MIKYDTLSIGDKVSVARFAGYGVMSSGVYTVSKTDKMKVVLMRDTDGYKRMFSLKTGRELGRTGLSHSFIESLDVMKAREVLKDRELELNRAWSAIQAAANNRDMVALRAAMAVLETA